ncbi:helix-turn-helix domain-containing protein [Maribacter sp. 2308TA10-17]|uniref:helix-turn-helix domain-containing protein n=1 Tax=Maribacter sp. 2308TA10-17 TaxID=3386276 RepID=UPI0039BD747C
MKYLNSLNRMATSAENMNNVLQLNPIILFLINESTNTFSTENVKGSSYYFHFKPCEDFKRTEPIIIGQYNGVFGCLDRSMDLKSFKPMSFMENGLSNQLAMYLMEELNQLSSEDTIQSENMVCALGNYLVKLLCEQKLLSGCLKMGITPYQIKNIHKYIEDKMEESISTGDLARIAGLSVHHFIRMFKRTTGETPHQCVIRLKLDQAKELLLKTRDNITQVGMGVGFDNPSHFSQLFKSNCGISPLKFRKAYSQNRMIA